MIWEIFFVLGERDRDFFDFLLFLFFLICENLFCEKNVFLFMFFGRKREGIFCFIDFSLFSIKCHFLRGGRGQKTKICILIFAKIGDFSHFLHFQFSFFLIFFDFSTLVKRQCKWWCAASGPVLGKIQQGPQ